MAALPAKIYRIQKVTRNVKKKDSFLGGKMQESILTCGAKYNNKPKNCATW